MVVNERNPGKDDMSSPNTQKLAEALCAADSILSLLHYRGLADSEHNRQSVSNALDKVTEFRSWYEARLREEVDAK